MRRLLPLLGLLAGLAAAGAALADAGADARYHQLLAQAKSASGQVDWTALRQAYAASEDFDLRGEKTKGARKAMFEAMNAGDFKTAAAHANFILAVDYVDIDAHVVLDIAAQQSGDKAGAQREHDIVVGILQSIHTGDGLSPEHAFTPISIGEEYAMLRAFSLEPKGQALVQANGHSYDRLDVAARDGKTMSLYFLVDAVLARELPPRPPAQPQQPPQPAAQAPPPPETIPQPAR